jgi:hypothetical protein
MIRKLSKRGTEVHLERTIAKAGDISDRHG